MAANRFGRIDEERLGTLVIVGLAVGVFGFFGFRELVSEPGIVLGIVGLGFAPLLLAGLIVCWMVATGTRRGAAPVLAMGLAAIGVAGAAAANDMGLNIVVTGLVGGVLIIARSFLVSYQRRAGIHSGKHSGLSFGLAMTWLVLAGLIGDGLTALRLAALAIVTFHLLTLGTWFDELVDRLEGWRRQLMAERTEPAESFGNFEPMAGAAPGDELILTPEQRRVIARIRAFIEANYDKWGEIDFIQPINSPRYMIYGIKQPLTIKKGTFVDRSDDLAAALGIQQSKVMISQNERGFQVEIAKENPDAVHFDTAIESWGHMCKHPLEIICGVNPYDEPVISRLDEASSPHTLTAGTTGSGKSIWLHTALVQLLLRNSPQELRILWGDAGLTTQSLYSEIPHLWRPLVKEQLEMIHQLRELQEERNRRARMFDEHGVQSLHELEQATGERLPRILYLVDEAATLTDSSDADNVGKPFKEILKNLLENSRKFGFHIILGIQRPMVDTLGRGVRDLLARRIIFKLQQAEHSEIILDGDPRAAKLRGSGDGIFKQADSERFQALFLADKLEEAPKGHMHLRDYIKQIIEQHGGPNDFGSQQEEAKKASEVAISAKSDFAAEHRETVSDLEWAILRALDKGMSNVIESYDDREWSPAGLLPFLHKVLPQSHPLVDAVDAEQVASTLGRLFQPERTKIWTLNREYLESRMAEQRRITARERDIVSGLLSFIAATPEKPDTLRTDKLLIHVNRPGTDGAVRSEPITADEINAALERLITPFAMGHRSWGRVRAVGKAYLNQPAAEATEPPRPETRRRVDVARIASRPTIER